MIPFLLRHMEGHIPSVFFYSSTRMILAAITTLLITIFLGPRFIKKLYEMKIGQHIRMRECPMLSKLHEKKKETPTMGGILILCSMLIALLLWMDLTSHYTWWLALATLWLGALGTIDDFMKLKKKSARGVPGRYKLVAQALFSGVLGFSLFWGSETVYYMPFFKTPIFIVGGVIALFITMFVVIGASNSVNLTDGLDGLAAGCVVMVSGVLAIMAFLSNHSGLAHYLNITYIERSGEIAVYLSAMFGASLGFLWYNGHPAQVFMGDTGSLALGGILGVSAVLLRREFMLALVGGVFVAEALSVILQVASFRLRGGKRIFLCAPLHHHFEYKGWPETKVVLRFWVVALILALIGLGSLKFQ